MILLDAYYADAIPSHLTTREFLRELKAKLALTGRYAPVDGLRHFPAWYARKVSEIGSGQPASVHGRRLTARTASADYLLWESRPNRSSIPAPG